MKHYLHIYALTCCLAVPLIAHEWPKPAAENEPLPFPDRCNCYAVEPDLPCVEWAWENCEELPDRERVSKYRSSYFDTQDYRE